MPSGARAMTLMQPLHDAAAGGQSLGPEMQQRRPLPSRCTGAVCPPRSFFAHATRRSAALPDSLQPLQRGKRCLQKHQQNTFNKRDAS